MQVTPRSLNSRIIRPQSGSEISCTYHVGLGENRMRRLDRSVAAHQKAVAIHTKLLAANPEDATLANELCAFYDAVADSERDRGQLVAALAASNAGLERARSWRDKTGETGWKLREADLLWGRARTAEALGNKQLAVDSLRAAQELFRAVDKTALTAMQQAVSTEVDKQLASLTGATAP